MQQTKISMLSVLAILAAAVGWS
ncbi:MAG: hypothetical protein RL289_905, partial [Actinomycetota bacterium]